MSSGLVTTTIIVSKVIRREYGGAFFTGQDESGTWIRVKADYNCIFRLPVAGEAWQLTGQFVYHEIYGSQLHVEHCRLTQPKGSLIKRYLRTHPAYRGMGLGPVKISELYERFGEKLLPILERGDVEALKAVLTNDTADKLVKAWCSNAYETFLIAFLNEQQIDSRIAGKILSYWGAGAIEKLRENPYRLLIILEWAKVDSVAMNLGFKPLNPLRMIAATEACLYRQLDKGRNTLVDQKSLRTDIRRLTGVQDKEISRKAIELSVNENAIVGNPNDGYQAVGCAVMERFLAERFTTLLTETTCEQIDLFGTSGKNSLVDCSIESFERQEGINLNVEQRRAIHMASTCSLSVLKGGAGVGKTTVLNVLYKVVRAMNHNVFQMALAGRAAQRMREMTGEDAYTIAGFLNHLQHGKLDPQPRDLVVIDESSMLDLMIVYRLIRSLPKGTRLLFVGDPYQLPPIGPGLVFHVLTNSSSVPSTELVEIHRQAESTGIPRVANLIRNGIIPNFNEYSGVGSGVSFIECASYAVMDQLMRIVADLGSSLDAQILGVIKSGTVGVYNINQIFHNNNMGASKPCLYGWNLAESDPIIFTSNDYERELFNGSLGYLESVIPKGGENSINCNTSLRALANFDGRQIALSSEDLNKIELAYAITVHKSQGSQFKRVIIPISTSRLLDRTLIYTALTRGVEQVVLLGSRKALNAAIINPPSASLRRVGFSV